MIALTPAGKNVIEPFIVIFMLLCAFISQPAFAVSSFQSAVSYTVGDEPIALIAADVNKDGALDLISLDSRSDQISVLLGNGNGSFAPAIEFPTGSKPVSIVGYDFYDSRGFPASDFNEDGNIDLIVANEQDKSFSLLFGDGNGNFSDRVTYAIGKFPQWVGIGDLNFDNYLDVVIVTKKGSVVIFYRSMDGSFSSPALLENVGDQPNCALLIDLSEDGILDLAIGNNRSKSITLLLGDGEGVFTHQADYPCSDSPETMQAFDYDGNGIIDLIITTKSDISALPGIGDGAFGEEVILEQGQEYKGMVRGDFNGDCLADLAVIDFKAEKVLIFPGNESGEFEPAEPFQVGGKITAVAFGDFNSDLKADLAFTIGSEDSVTVFLSDISEVCSMFLLHRASNPVSVRTSVAYATAYLTPFDDMPGSLIDGQNYFYLVEHAGGLPARLSASKNTYLDAVRLGFNDGNPLSAPVDPSSSTVSVDKSLLPADGMSAATVTVIPRDANGILLGSGCNVSVDEILLSPAALIGPVQDTSSGRYTFQIISTIPCSVDVAATVEGIALNGQPTITFTEAN